MLKILINFFILINVHNIFHYNFVYISFRPPRCVGSILNIGQINIFLNNILFKDKLLFKISNVN